MNNDHVYWTFSAAAQSISAFIAFLLTGYAIVLTLMDAAREEDDTLEDVHLVLLNTYHLRLTVLAWATGAAIVLSLLTVFTNRWEFRLKGLLLFVTTISDVIAIGGGVAFVITIVNPSKYKKAATAALESVRKELGLSKGGESSTEFFNAFRHLERLIRDYVRRMQLFLRNRGPRETPFSFRDMIDALLQNEKIDSDFHTDLAQINKYRNLVFHGHVDTADRTMVERTRRATQRVQDLP